MAEQQTTEQMWLVAEVNDAANAQVTATSLSVAEVNGNANAQMTEIVWLGVVPRAGFRELITPLTSHDE